MSFGHQIRSDADTVLLNFVTVTGIPDGIRNQYEVIAQKGRDGSYAWLTGARGTPFEITTGVDAASLGAAMTAMAGYRALVSTPVIYRLYHHGAFFSRVLLLDVRPVTQIPLANATGGLNPPSLAWLEATWQMLAINPAAE
jgi:hypothetical protein